MAYGLWPRAPGRIRRRLCYLLQGLVTCESVQAITNPLWTKIAPGIAGLAAGSHARRPALNEIREFRKTMPRPRRGSELVFGGQRAAKSSWRCSHTHTTTGGLHVSHISARPVAWQLGQGLLAARRGVLAILPAQSVRVATTGHQGSQYLLQGKRTY
jgi:hypothetical protein